MSDFHRTWNDKQKNAVRWLAERVGQVIGREPTMKRAELNRVEYDTLVSSLAKRGAIEVVPVDGSPLSDFQVRPTISEIVAELDSPPSPSRQFVQLVPSMTEASMRLNPDEQELVRQLASDYQRFPHGITRIPDLPLAKRMSVEAITPMLRKFEAYGLLEMPHHLAVRLNRDILVALHQVENPPSPDRVAEFQTKFRRSYWAVAAYVLAGVLAVVGTILGIIAFFQ